MEWAATADLIWQLTREAGAEMINVLYVTLKPAEISLPIPFLGSLMEAVMLIASLLYWNTEVN